jgi:hypothetical protein
VHNLDEQYRTRGLLSMETTIGSIVPVFTTAEAAQRYLDHPAIEKHILEGGGAKGIIEETAPSFDDWRFRLRMMDRSADDVTYLLDTDPVWRTIHEQLS